VTPVVATTRAPFRVRPPELPDGLVVRDRLLDELGHRFDRRLTVVRAGPGFGKTTLLTHAIVENALDPVGTDVWMQLFEQDRRPDHFVAGLAASLASVDLAVLDPSSAPTLDEVIEWVWAAAPRPIALVLDDVHLLDGSPSMELLAELCEQLPANAHLVLGTRALPALPIRLLQARGQACVIDEGDLAFTADERSTFVRVHGVAVDDDDTLPSWPALAVLMSSVGQVASIEFLWDAVLGSLEPRRRHALGLLVEFGSIDDDLVNVVVGSTWTADTLLDGLPLIESNDRGHRFHDLWRAALAGSIPPAVLRDALATGAERLAARGELVRAARCLRAAGADERLVRLARDFGAAPISAGLDAAVADALVECLPSDARAGALGRYLRVITSWSFRSDHVLAELRDIFRLADQDGDRELAALALWRATQLIGDIDPATLSHPEVADLVGSVRRYADDGWPMARCALALIVSHGAEQRLDVAAALEAVDMFDGLDPAIVQSSVISRFLALGHPERVLVTLEEVLAEGVSEPVRAQAVWLRGDIDPSDAWPIVADIPAAYARRNLPNVQVPLLGVLTTVALAAGDLEGARRTADDALEFGRNLFPRPYLFAQVADALVTLAVDGDSAATRRFTSMVAGVPLEPWPSWAYMGSLCAMRALLPDTEWLDDVEFGPSIRTAVAAGRAVVALRDDLDAGPAAALPWRSVELLRVHVPPSMLCELSLGVVEVIPAAAACLERIPGALRWVRGLVDHPHPAVRTAARHRTLGVAEPPPYTLSIETFGRFTIRRSDGVAVSDRVRGGRVHQLLARLLLDRSLSRTAIAAHLWPDLDDKQASANLRVTLNTLLDAVEPDRRPGTSWFIRTEEGRLSLATEGIDVDLRRFDSFATAARDAERSGRLTVALQHHRDAFSLYRGEFLPGVVDDDVEHERLRLQTLAYNSGCRVGELLLAKGEPEAALRVILNTISVDPYSERARRAEIRCHLALGSALAARSTAQSLRRDLDEHGVGPDRETALLLARADPGHPDRHRERAAGPEGTVAVSSVDDRGA
jgi:DNA-binding SARP family transcriptional activator